MRFNWAWVLALGGVSLLAQAQSPQQNQTSTSTHTLMAVLRPAALAPAAMQSSASQQKPVAPQNPPAAQSSAGQAQAPKPATEGAAAGTGVTPTGKSEALKTSPLIPTKATELKVAVEGGFTFAAFGDLRETQPDNHSATDPERRQAIIAEIARLNPKFVLVSGDLVYKGQNAADWKQWEDETAAWTKEKLPVFPVLGNHELWGDQAKALDNYFQNFPQLERSRYYMVRAGNVVVLALDSSLPTTSGPQFDWLKERLEKLGKNVGFAVVLLHHPPITHSTDRLFGGGHSVRPAEAALGHFLEDEQQKIAARIVVIAGHVHNYERYERGGVTFIVSGGGGASPYEIPRAEGDVYKDPGPSYHYLKIDVSGATMRIGMEKLILLNQKAVWNERDSVEIQSQVKHELEKPGHRLPPD